MLFSVLRFDFCPKVLFFALFDNAEAFVVLETNINHQSTVRLQQPNNNSPFTCNLIQNTHILFRFQQPLNNKAPFACNKKTKLPYVVSHETKNQQHRPQAAIKQVYLYKPSIYDKQLGFNYPAVIITDYFLPFSGISLLQWFFAKHVPESFATVFRNKYTTIRLRSLANMFLLRIFVLRYNSTLSGFFHGTFHRLLLFTKKYFSHQSFCTCRLRYEINTTKTN